MLKTIEMNHKKNIVPVNLGLGSKNCKAEIPNLVGVGNRTNYVDSAQGNGKETAIVDIVTLDEYVDKNKLEVGLIKVDIEGNEQDFLKGAEKVIRSQKPALLISIYHNPADFFQIKSLIEGWNLGYKFKIAKCHSPYICIDTLLIAEVNPEEG
jgi:FkbM family methyltransferase